MILSIDEGTTGTHCYVFDEQGRIAGSGYREFVQHFPRPGWVEHDADEIWQATVEVAGEALADAKLDASAIRAVGLTNQRETVVVWDRATGEPLHNAIVWQDRRTAERCDELKAQGAEDLVRERTGLVIDAYFSGTKIEWLLGNVEGLDARASKGEVCCGTIDAWLAFKLTGRAVTDASNASRTMLFDIHALRWDRELCELLGVPEAALPEVVSSSGVVAEVMPDRLHGLRAPLAGIAGDQQAALFGQACHRRGLGKNTYGTGSFVLLNTGGRAAPASPGLVTTIAWKIGDQLDYALEASMFVTGSAVQWLRDGLGIIESADETEALAASLDSNDDVYFVPALTGLGSPYWDPYARGTIVGLTRGTGRAHLARATLESIAYQTVDAVEAMERTSDERLEELRVDGGAVANGWLMQFQADVLGRPVVVPEVSQTTALGAALLAGLGIGAWTRDDVGAGWHEAQRYEPTIGDDQRASLLGDWRRAVERSRGWAR
ncbi:MAG: glycerol kinase GlpK [Solirubrobacterales bacterium]